MFNNYKLAIIANVIIRIQNVYNCILLQTDAIIKQSRISLLKIVLYIKIHVN